jgi:predicted amino acid dehydrogenase
MNNNTRFAFIVHSRDRSDLPRKFPILKFFPNFIFDLITLKAPPFIVSRVTGLQDKNNQDIEGIVIGIPMTAHQLLEHRALASKKVLQASKLAKSKGANFIGLGAMTASLTRGGRDVIDNIKDICVTTGRTYTTKNVSEYVDYCIEKFNLDKNKVKIAIVGAAGGIGSGTAIVLARKGYKNFLLIDLERKLEHLKKRIEVIEKHALDLSIEISHQISRVSESHIIIAATSAPEVVLMSYDISPGTIIINDAQPPDVSPEIIRSRSDVLVIEGGVLSTLNINCHFNMGLVQKSDIFSCLAETLLLAHRNSNNHYSIDDFDPNLYQVLYDDGKKVGFRISKLQNELGYIPKQQLEEFAKIIRARFV